MKEYWDKDFYEIYMNDKEKWIHVLGYFYIGNDNGSGDSRQLDYCGFDIPLSEFLSDDFDYETYQEQLTQYIEDMEEDEAVKRMNDIVYTPLLYDELTMETPCGFYVDSKITADDIKEIIEKLEYSKFLLAMKDMWNGDDYQRDREYSQRIKELKTKLKEVEEV